MYDYDDGPKEIASAMQECKPDYEAMVAALKKRMDVYARFKGSLVEFIQTIGRYRLRREPSSLNELLGKVTLDCLDQEREYSSLLSKIEDGS